MGAVRRSRTLIFRAEHGRNRRPVNIGIQNADFRPFRRQRQREIDRRRRFTHPALAGADGDNVFHAVDARLIFYPLKRGDAVRQLPVNGFGAGNAQQLGAALLLQRFKRAVPDERHLNFNVHGLVQPGDVMQRLQRSEVMFQGWVLEISQGPGDHRAQTLGGFGLGLRTHPDSFVIVS